MESHTRAPSSHAGRARTRADTSVRRALACCRAEMRGLRACGSVLAARLVACVETLRREKCALAAWRLATHPQRFSLAAHGLRMLLRGAREAPAEWRAVFCETYAYVDAQRRELRYCYVTFQPLSFVDGFAAPWLLACGAPEDYALAGGVSSQGDAAAKDGGKDAEDDDYDAIDATLLEAKRRRTALLLHAADTADEGEAARGSSGGKTRRATARFAELYTCACERTLLEDVCDESLVFENARLRKHVAAWRELRREWRLAKSLAERR